MVLKTMRRKIYNPDDSTEKFENYEVNYIGNVAQVIRTFDYKELSTDITLVFNDNSTLRLVLSVEENNAEKMLYDNVFLLNDKGETIERLI